MNPTSLIGPASPLGAPAPYWVLVFFKVLGFTLHMGPMNLWFAGLPLAMLLGAFGGVHAKRQSARLMLQMPLIIAAGVNLGIVPLLFLQVAYYRVFYPATILEAWAWFAVIAFLCAAYYGVYLYAIALKTGGKMLTRWAKWAGWGAAGLFVIIGFIFAHTMSLMTNIRAWEGIFSHTNVAGGVLGIGNNFGDPTLIPRYLMMFGLALVTCAAYFSLDAALFATKDTPEYKAWVGGFAWKLGLVGMLWFAVFGSWYTFGTWQTPIREAMLSGVLLPLTVLTAISPGLTWLLLLLNRAGTSRALALGAVHAQLAVLALNAVSRQIVQNRELAPYFSPAAEKVNLQLSPLIVFLVLFVAGVGLLIWMIRKAAQAQGKPVPSGK
jgi:hypothetical protein